MEDARVRTRDMLTNLLPEEIDWTATGVDNSIGAILYHIALIEFDYLCADILGMEEYFADITAMFPWEHRDESGHLATAPGLSLDNHLGRLDAVRSRFLETLAPFDRERLSIPRTFPDWDYDITPEWTLHHLIQHESEHRGEIGAIRSLYKAAV